MPTRWLDDLEKNPPFFRIDKELAELLGVEGVYLPPFNSMILENPIDIAQLSDEDLALFAHELFHAWYDTVPSWHELWLDENSEEAVAEFLNWRVEGKKLTESFDAALQYGKKRGGGSETDGLNGLKEMQLFWKDGDLFGSFANAADKAAWDKLKKSKWKDHSKALEGVEADIGNPR